MADLAVTSEYLQKLATAQDQAATTAGAAATAASGIETEVWVSHGVVCADSNIAFAKAEAARRAVGEALKNACTDLAAKLRAANQAYQSTDEQTGSNIDRQVVAG